MSSKLKEINIVSKLKRAARYVKISKKGLWIGAVALVLVIAAGFAYYKLAYLPSQTSNVPALQTATVRQGDLVLYASGTGTLIPAAEATFGFRSGGQITDLLVKVGDKVEAGQLLAQIDDKSAQTQYTQAKRNLLELTSPASVALARQNVAQAEADVKSARDYLAYLISPSVLSFEEKVAEAEQALLEVKAEAEANPSEDAQKKVEEAEAALKRAKSGLVYSQAHYEKQYVPNIFTFEEIDPKTHKIIKYIAPPTEIAIATARAGYTLAQELLLETQFYLTALTSGEVPEDATGSALTQLEQAQIDLRSAEDDIAATRLYAPISGTVMAVDVQEGDTVGTSSIITIADLSTYYLDIFLDETDWDQIKVGYDVEVVFDALPERVFTGQVVQVDPGLYTQGNTSVVRGLVQLDNKPAGLNLPIGSGAAVDVIGGRADNAVLVPVEALHETAPGEYTVFVWEDGKTKLRVVEIGIKDIMYAEVKSGLKLGELVTTGIVETK